MILVLSAPHDEHAQYVLVELAKLDADARLIDLSEFPLRLGLSMHYGRDRHDLLLGCQDSGLDLDDCDAIWWRRPQAPDLGETGMQPSHRRFALNECAEALDGLWQSVDAFWMNDPNRDRMAHRKAYQLRVAAQLGLEIPRTLITNCSRSAADFIAHRAGPSVVYKPFSATAEEWRETRLVRDDEVDLLRNVKYAPVIFQEYIEADVDLRITIVAGDIFAAAIYSQETSYKVDCRMDLLNARIEETRLPAEVEDKLRALMRRLGLVYGAVDMRRTPDGRHVFLEINPAGQWLFVELRTGQPITESVARQLVAGRGLTEHSLG